MPLPIILALLFILAALSFFISASEVSVVGINKIRLRHLASQGIKRAQSVQRLIADFDNFITAVLICNNFVNTAISAIVTVIFVSLFGSRMGVLLATFITTIGILIFCEITPKILGIKHSEKFAFFGAPIWEAVVRLLLPVIRIFTRISGFILKAFGVASTKRSPLITEEELRMMIEVGKEEGVLSDEERKMLHRIFEFGDTKVKDVMVPKEKMIIADINSSPEDLLNIFVEQGHARLPLYQKSPDNIIGIIYAHDLLYILRDKGLFLLQDLLYPPYYVSGSTKVNELLRYFQLNKLQIAIVVDDAYKAIGLVTLEDLLEEIVGEIGEETAKYSKNPDKKK